ncbi:rCG59770 [Rattus norvegicus]|uniref:RCG59770 n=1 Tax=Rattus norvegicus TaxID=10116 RepID=A6HR56_RAT|nr:rCG59770 [Rattus norvegicus]
MAITSRSGSAAEEGVAIFLLLMKCLRTQEPQGKGKSGELPCLCR